MKQILFFATGNDLLPVLEEVERVGPLHYARMGQFPKPEPETFSRGGELPRLGQSDGGVRDKQRGVSRFRGGDAGPREAHRRARGRRTVRRRISSRIRTL